MCEISYINTWYWIAKAVVEALHKAEHVSAVACSFSTSMEDEGQITLDLLWLQDEYAQNQF